MSVLWHSNLHSCEVHKYLVSRSVRFASAEIYTQKINIEKNIVLVEIDREAVISYLFIFVQCMTKLAEKE